MSKRIEIDLHPYAAAATTVLASATGAAADWAINHPTEVTDAMKHFGVGGIVGSIVLAGLLPQIAKRCHAAAGDAPPSPEAAAINTTLQASDAGPDVPAFEPGVRVPIIAPPNTDRASAAAATAALPTADQGI